MIFTILHGKTNGSRLCVKGRNAYNSLVEWGLKVEGDFPTPYQAHKWFKENGYVQTGRYTKDVGDIVEVWRHRSDIH